jgi:ankyrin repeat protein
VKRSTLFLGAILVVVAGVGGWKYYEHLEEKREAQARLQAAMAVRKALEARKKAETVSPEDQEKLVAMARQWLDEGDFHRARAPLETVLKSNRHNVAARIEMARYHILSGHINYRNFQPGALDSAIRELTYVLQADPKSANAYVMLGNVQYLRGYPWQAISDLEKAEKLGGEANPWLYLNWAQSLIELNRLDDAEAKLKQAEAVFAARPPASRVRLVLHERYSSLYELLHRLDEADKHHRAQLELAPRAAQVHGDYAAFLLFRRGLPDAAMSEAEQALKLANYGMGRLTLAAARYAKWAELKRKDPARAAELLVAAKADTPDFSWIMPQAAHAVEASPAVQNMVKELVNLGVSINTKDEHGDTGMTLAAYAGRLRSVQILAKMGASLESRDNDGRTALIIAARRGHLDVAKALLARGARVNVQDTIGKTALHWAVGESDEAMVRALLGMKANVNLATTSGYTALMQAAYAGNASMVRRLLAAGADPAAATIPEKRTAADLAEDRGHKELAETLRRGAKKH